MVGTMTAPTMVTAATYRALSIHFVDASGDVWTENFRTPIATTAAQIDTLIADIQERSNASVWRVDDIAVRQGAAATTNASKLPRSESVFDTVFLTFKQIANNVTYRIYIPAPLEATLLNETDSPDNTDLADVATAAGVVLGAGFVWQSSRYSEHREMNEAEKP